VIRKFPHIQDYRAYKVPSTLDAKTLLKCQLAVATFNCKHIVLPYFLTCDIIESLVYLLRFIFIY